MQKISGKSIFTFSNILTLCIVLSLTAATAVFNYLKSNSYISDFAAIFSLLFFMIFLVGFTIISLRIWTSFFYIQGHSHKKNMNLFHIYQMHYLILGPVLRSYLVPVPMTGLLYRLLGARIGENSYTAGVIYDAHLVKIGENCILGENTLLTPHQMEGSTLSFLPIEIGSNVTIGAHSVILADVKIADGAIIAAGSVVKKGTRISKNEIWGGVPAKLISKNNLIQDNSKQELEDIKNSNISVSKKDILLN